MYNVGGQGGGIAELVVARCATLPFGHKTMPIAEAKFLRQVPHKKVP
jgi:hypothetical protein